MTSGSCPRHHFWNYVHGFAYAPSSSLYAHFSPCDHLPFRVTPSVITHCQQYRNINLLSIDYAFQPRLRVRLTLGGFTVPRKP